MHITMTREADTNYVYLYVTEGKPSLALENAVVPSGSGSGDLDEDYSGDTPTILATGDDSSPRVIDSVAVTPNE